MTIERGRGATANRISARFGLPSREVDGDWQDAREQIDGPTASLKTTTTVLKSKTIISYNRSPDIGFNRSINPYSGCEHGCIYCYARPSHAWHDLSPGLDFETRLFVKPNAAELLRTELAHKNYRVAPLAIGTNTDGYQPVERDWLITRELIKILAECRHPLLLTTKSDRLLRDIDLLSQMAKDNLVYVTLSITTLDPALSRILEPRAPHPMRRIRAVQQLSDAGIPTQVNIAPVIPAITDHEVEAIVEASASAGAHRAAYILLRLPHEVSPLFRDWLSVHYPDRAKKVMTILHDLRDGRDNSPQFFERMKGRGVWADLLRLRFRKAIRACGLDRPPPHIRSDLFRPPVLSSDQLDLFSI